MASKIPSSRSRRASQRSIRERAGAAAKARAAAKAQPTNPVLPTARERRTAQFQQTRKAAGQAATQRTQQRSQQTQATPTAAPSVVPTPAEIGAQAKGPLPGETPVAATPTAPRPVPTAAAPATVQQVPQQQQTQQVPRADISRAFRAAEPANRFGVLEQNASFNDALKSFRQDNPGVNIDPNNTSFQRQAERVIAQAEQRGADPAEALDKLMLKDKFHISNKQQQQFNTSQQVATKDGGVDSLDIGTPNNDFNTGKILVDYLSKDSGAILAEIQKNPEKFAEMFSGDYVSEILGANIVAGAQNDIETQKALQDEKAIFESFADRHEAVIKQDLEEDIKLVNDTKIIDKMKTDLEKQRIIAERDDVMGQLKEKRGRLESYLKVKMNVEGLTSSASGLSLLVSKVTAFDKMVANTGLKYSQALVDLNNGLQERSLQYAAQILKSSRAARNGILKIDEDLLTNKSKIERSKILSAQSARMGVLEAVGKAMEQKQRIKEKQKQQEIDVWKEANRAQEKQMDRAFELHKLETNRINDQVDTFSKNFTDTLSVSGVVPTADMVAAFQDIQSKVSSGDIGAGTATAAMTAVLGQDPNYQKYVDSKIKTATANGWSFSNLGSGQIMRANKNTGEYSVIATQGGGEAVDEPKKGSIKYGDPVPGFGIVSAPGGGSGRWKFGLDVANTWGTPIQNWASIGGVVEQAEDTGNGFGLSVKIRMPEELGGEIHQYSHMSGTHLKPGDIIQPGDFIGLMGNTGDVISGGKLLTKEERAIAAKKGNYPGTHLDFTVRDSSGRPKNVEKAYQVLMGRGMNRPSTSSREIILDENNKPITFTTKEFDLSPAARAIIGGSGEASFQKEERANASKELALAGFIKGRVASKKDIENANDGLRAIALIRKEIFTNGKFDRKKVIAAKAKFGFFGARNTLSSALATAGDVVTRIRTGAALNESEITFYDSLLPGILDDERSVKFKLDQLENLYSGVAKELPWRKRPEALLQSFQSNNPTVILNSPSQGTANIVFTEKTSDSKREEIQQSILQNPELEGLFRENGFIQ